MARSTRLQSSLHRGFTLLELMLVLTIIAVLMALSITQMEREAELSTSKAAGEQISVIGQAANAYMANYYNDLSYLVPAAVGTPGGPRTCNTANRTCSISVATLIADGDLPVGFTGVSPFQAAYIIQISSQPIGGTPIFSLNGLVISTQPWVVSGVTRYDLLGSAVREAGASGGYTTTASLASGYDGSWTAPSSTYPVITAPGQLAYLTGYSTSGYSAFLRRDGSLPMTGALDMGNNDVYNAKDIIASGGVEADSVFVDGGVLQLSPSTQPTGVKIFRNGSDPNQAVIEANDGVLLVDNAGAPADLAAVQNINSAGNVSVKGSVVTNGPLQVLNNNVVPAAANTPTLYNQGNLANTGMLYTNQLQIAADPTGTACASFGTTDDPNGNPNCDRVGIFGSGLVSSDWDVYNTLVTNHIAPFTGSSIIDFDGASAYVRSIGGQGGSMYLDNGLYLNVSGSVAVPYAGCPSQGEISRTDTGALMICNVSGLWQPTSVQAITAASGPTGATSIATCPGGTIVVSGGYSGGNGSLTGTGAFGGSIISNGQFAPAQSYMIPPGTAGGGGWEVVGANGATAQAIAYCAKFSN